MTSDITTPEVSQRLKDVGFSARTNAFWGKDEFFDENDCWYEDWALFITESDYSGTKEDMVYAYSASTLFEYLRENHGKIPALDFDLWTIYAYGEGSFEPIADYKTSLADMLAEAIIWIKEKENK